MLVTIVEKENNKYLYSLVGDEVGCHSFQTHGHQYTLLEFYHSLWGQRQDHSVRAWISAIPYGPCLNVIPIPLQQINPVRLPYRIAMYADQADVVVTEATWNDGGFADGVNFDVAVKRNPRRSFRNFITITTGLPGTYWINFQNLSGQDNGYYFKKMYHPLD
jgi:hypothetical protein